MEIKRHISEQAMDHKRTKRKIKKYLGTNKNGITKYGNANAAKAVERGKFREINAYIKKQTKKQLSNI